MEQAARERELLWVFDLALILKIINGALEVSGALLVLFVRPAFVLRIAEFVTANEIAQDADDFVAQTIRNTAHSFAIHTHYFLAAYLFLHGIVKIALVLGIFAGKRIAYPLFIAALIIFGAYEAYRGALRHEALLGFLALFDFALAALTVHEYRQRYPHSSSGY